MTHDDLKEIQRIVFAINNSSHTLGYFNDQHHPAAEKENSAAWNDFGRWLQRLEDEINGIGTANNGCSCVVAGMEIAPGCVAASAD